MTPHPELIRLLAQLVREVAEAGPQPILAVSGRLEYLGWLVRGMRVEPSANDSTWPSDLG